MSLIKHKKVELTELFYDLVYVYTISQMTSIIHHVHHGIVSPFAFLTFAVGLIIFINSWMVQTVFTNRFGKNSLTNIIFMFLQMMCLLVSSVAVSGDWSQNFAWIFLPLVAISLILLLQYIVEYLRSDNPADKTFIQQFFYILGLRSLSLLVAVFLPYTAGMVLAITGVVVTWLLPAFLTNPKRRRVSKDLKPINFPHLVERLSLLVIITFGEMIVGIAPYFSPERLSLQSFLIFLIVSNLFMIYIVEIDHMIDVNKADVTGNGAIYYHYPIFFGLSFITVSLSFLGNHEANSLFAVSILYLGILLVMAGLLAHHHYNKESHLFTKELLLAEFGFPLVAWLLSLFFLGSSLMLILLAFLATTVMVVIFIRFNLRRVNN